MGDINYCFDAWAIRQLENDDKGHEHWDDDEEKNEEKQEKEE